MQKNRTMPRDYKKEYKRDHASAKSKLDRASRNKARREALRKGRVKKGGTTDVHHKDGNPRNNAPRNLQVVPRSANRREK